MSGSSMHSPLRLGFTGDVMLGRLVDRHQRNRLPEAVWGEMLDRLRSLDGLFLNLECCLSTRGRRWTRTYRPFHFRADPAWAIPALRTAGVDWVALANNHVLDYGPEALVDTLDHLDRAGIDHAGAGRTLEEAREPSLVAVADGALTVGLVSFTDNTPEYAATPDSPGTAYVEIDHTDDRTRAIVRESLSALRASEPDLLVASLHWGPNMVESPPDAFRDFALWLVEQGVDVVHGHSAHVFQGIEVDKGKLICYDTGDFVDDYAVDPELRNDRSFLFELHIERDGKLRELRLVPTEIDEFAVQPASAGSARWSRDCMRARSEPFGTSFDLDDGELRLPLSGF